MLVVVNCSFLSPSSACTCTVQCQQVTPQPLPQPRPVTTIQCLHGMRSTGWFVPQVTGRPKAGVFVSIIVVPVIAARYSSNHPPVHLEYILSRAQIEIMKSLVRLEFRDWIVSFLSPKTSAP